MSQRSRPLGGSNGLSLARLDRSKNNLVSPGRPALEKPSSAFQGGEQIMQSQKALSQKTPQTSIKQGERKHPSLSNAKGTVTSINLTDFKKQTTSSSQPELLNSLDTTPLPQLDISNIAPADCKIEVSGFQISSTNKNQTFQTGTNNSMITSSLNTATNTGTNFNTSLNQKKAISLQSNQLQISAPGAYNTMSKSPGKSGTINPNSTGTGFRKADSINQSVNMMQSANMGTASATNGFNFPINTAPTNYTNLDSGNMSLQFNANANAAGGQAFENSINFEVLKQFDMKQKSSNVKTFIRVRPLNKMEIEFNENGCGNENLKFPDVKTICVMPEKMPFSLDKVYPPDVQQEQIYEDVGKEMVSDVLQGYNGTIFAYGPTGSGKTFTMFGDLNESKLKGIIPRVSNQIFSHINSVEQDVEFTLTCSMLEIYKEHLFDLLKVERVGLKIKENPQKGGIYVQGLTTISVDCEEEILDAIKLGYQSKQTRETRMNEYSSRSHTIFTINVTQRFPNGQEKTGKLNLVDLAGSEKVGKSGAVGESLEEAKKINLSLSCLGNVIHALTTNSDHIPYRDSKLTRILQESLGGNYKTSLVATISPHSSQHEEQISTLRFASRAKTIKNQVKMNVKLSVDQMRKLIEQLKTELEKAKTVNSRFRNIIKKLKEELMSKQLAFMQPSKDGKITDQQQAMQNTVKALEEMLNISDLDQGEDSGTKVENIGNKANTSKLSYEDSELDESTINNNLNNNSNNPYFQGDPAAMDSKGMPSQFSAKRMGSQQRTLSNQIGDGTMSRGDIPIGRGANLDFKAAYNEKLSECRSLEKELMELKKELLEKERSFADFREEKNKLECIHTKQMTKNDYNKFQKEILEKQVQSLVDSICKNENTIGNLMREKQDITQKKVEDLLKEKLNFSEIRFSEYFKKSINFNYDNLVQKWADVQKNMKTIGLDDQELFKSQSDLKVLDDDRSLKQRGNVASSIAVPKPIDEMTRGSFIGNLDFNQVSNAYDQIEEIIEFPDQLEKFNTQHPISRDLMIILLKKQLFNSHIINQHLARTINALEWKQIIEYGKAKMKSVLNKVQSKHIYNLEQVISEASLNYRNLRNRIEQVELETQFVKEKMDGNQDNAPKKSKIIKDSESIRSLLMKPSNEGIRQSLRGSYIGFQLDLDKQVENPIMKELKEVDELVQKQLLPLTYDRAIEELKQRNALIRKSYAEMKGGFFNGVSQDFVEQVLREKERLEGKITILSNELKMESSKSDHYSDAYKAEKQNFQMQKEQTKELESFLVNKMKEESELIERSQKKISDSHEKEILKYKQGFQRVSDRFQDYIRNSINRLLDLKKSTVPIQPNQIEDMLKEMLSVKEAYTKLFSSDALQNSIGGESPNSLPQGTNFNPNSLIFRSFDNGFDHQSSQVLIKNDERSTQIPSAGKEYSHSFSQNQDEVKEVQSNPQKLFMYDQTQSYNSTADISKLNQIQAPFKLPASVNIPNQQIQNFSSIQITTPKTQQKLNQINSSTQNITGYQLPSYVQQGTNAVLNAGKPKTNQNQSQNLGSSFSTNKLTANTSGIFGNRKN